MKILGRMFCIEIEKTNQCSSEKLIHLFIEDDGNWFELKTNDGSWGMGGFDSYWLDDLIEILTKAKAACG